MTELIKEKNAFVRPSPTRLQLGGVAAHTVETILVCEAAGFDRIIIETVGVGQSETLASQLADAVLLLLVSGTGDELQGVKKGILESADFVLVNKADGDNEKPAKIYAAELDGISTLWPLRRNGEKAFVMSGSTIENASMGFLFDQIEKFKMKVEINGEFKKNRQNQKIDWMKALVLQRMVGLMSQKMGLKALIEKGEHEVRNGNGLVSLEVSKMMDEIQSKILSSVKIRQ